MIPGWTCTHHFFQKNIAALAQSCRVIAPDMRAHGDSAKVPWGHRIARYAKDVKDLIEALRLEHVTVLGWSMGAAICWSYLDLFGTEHLAGHVSVDQSPRQYYNETWRWGQPGCYDAEALAMLTIRLEYDAGGVARGLVPACFGETYQPTPDEVEALAREIDKCPPKVRADIMADHTHLDWRDLFPQITLPALVCVGRQSKSSRGRAARMWASTSLVPRRCFPNTVGTCRSMRSPRSSTKRCVSLSRACPDNPEVISQASSGSLAESGPNNRLQATAHSVRSCLAPAASCA